MKIFFKILLAVIIAGAIIGFIYWQQHKKGIIKNAVQNAIQKKSDSLYFIHYDSSRIDEVGGNASFYNVTLQSDSFQKKTLQRTDSLPNVLYNISAREITVRGVDVAGLLQGSKLNATAIVITKPVVQVINTGAEKPKPFTANDTLELYKKILGKFTSISADSILIVNGTVLITDKVGKPLTTLEKINISLNHFLIDSTRNYQNIISYFIKDVRVTVENIQLPESANSNRLNITNLLYDAPQSKLQAASIQQYKSGNTDALADVKNILISQLNTDAFIQRHQLNAGMVSADGGFVTIFKKSRKLQSGDEEIVLSNDLIDAARIGGIVLGKTKIVVLDQAQPGKPPLVLNGVTFKAVDIVSSSDGSTLSDVVNNAAWKLKASGCSFLNEDKTYRFTVSGVEIDNKEGSVKAHQVSYTPLQTEVEFSRTNSVQKDRYDLAFNNIKLSGVNFKTFVKDKVLKMEQASFQPLIKIFNDRTLAFDTSSRIGKYPNQSLLKIPQRLYVKKILVNNGSVFYKERGRKSGKTGVVSFTNINARISNVTNMQEQIKLNSTMQINASALFLQTAHVVTEWLLPLSKDTTFKVSGTLGEMDATVLNSITEPLGMAAVKKGNINSLGFDINGNNYAATGHTTFLYNDLGVSVLKLDDNDELKKRGFLSFFANTLIVNDNPKNNHTYVGEISFTRDTKKSFFNLLWKSIFDGVKNTVMRK